MTGREDCTQNPCTCSYLGEQECPFLTNDDTHCYGMEVDGEPVRLRLTKSVDQLSDKEKAMLTDIVRAAKRKVASDDVQR